MANHIIMLDSETLGVNPDAPILSIGCVSSDGVTFYRNLDVQQQLDAGAKADWSTVRWWMDQSKDAQNAIPARGDNVSESLYALVKAYDWENAEVWCNGTSFDIPILESAFRRERISVPWQYWQCRDLRTLLKHYEGLVQKSKPTVAHNALSDAEAQLATLMEILNVKKTRDELQKRYRDEATAQKGFVPCEEQ